MNTTRRDLMTGALAVSLATAIPTLSVSAAGQAPATKRIPSSGEELPLIGLGSWITFNVGNDAKLLGESLAVIRAFFDGGGRMIDSSPMYGSSQSTIGFGLKRLGYPRQLFSAEKVWIGEAAKGGSQIEQSRVFWGVPKFDLLQVHNLVSWERHLDTLFEMKANGALRYVGLTTSHGRRHKDLERAMAHHPVDFVQLTYNAVDREAEARLLPLARERGIAVIANRPFRRGALLRRVERQPLPKWVADTGAATWPQFLLKFIVSHPAVTCAIPATTRVDHVRENLAAGTKVLPDERLRGRMADYVGQL